jgi:dipeptidyl-peptidase-4
MLGPEVKRFLILLAGLAAIAPVVSAEETKPSEREAMYSRYLDFASYVKGGSVTPHWMADGSSFWYAEGARGNTVIYEVDPQANTKTPLFDAPRLRRALTTVLGHEPPHHGLPFAEFTFLKGEKSVTFILEKTEYILPLDSYEISRAPVLSEEEKSRRAPQLVGTYDDFNVMEELSPDGRWFAGIKDHNLYLRSTSDGRSVPLTTDGVKEDEWDAETWNGGPPWARWSPDSSKLAIKKVDIRRVPRIPIVHSLKRTEEVEWVLYSKAGEPKPLRELFVVDILSKRQIRVDTGEESDQWIEILGWRSDGSELLFFRVDRWGKKPQVMAANPETGATRVLFTDPTKMVEWDKKITLLTDGKRFLLRSNFYDYGDRESRNHLYLYDLDRHRVARLTEGDLRVGQVVAVDENAGWVYFTAQGGRTRPQDSHLYRVNLEGRGLMRLTEGTGRHGIRFAPSRQFFLDTHSSTDRPPVVELRRADGTLLRKLAAAKIDGLKALKWSPPEEFTVKTADGSTDVYGILYKPYDFAPHRKYPVIQSMNPWVRTFTRDAERQALAQLGFIVFGVDQSYQISPDLIRDEVAALTQLAAKRPYMDLRRVGVQGGSYGGWKALRAMLQAPELYQVGVVTAPITDMAEHSGWPAALGPPESNKARYEEASTLRLAGNLKGRLLLIHGTSDMAVPISHTMKMVDALVRADKHFDMLVLPEWGHWEGLEHERIEKYLDEASCRYFQEHLKP